jgi:hypothetical protein
LARPVWRGRGEFVRRCDASRPEQRKHPGPAGSSGARMWKILRLFLRRSDTMRRTARVQKGEP